MKKLMRGLLFFVVLSILTGLVYPFLITGVAQLVFPRWLSLYFPDRRKEAF